MDWSVGLPGSGPAAAIAAVGERLRRVAARVKARAAAAVTWVRRRTPEQVLGVTLVLVLLAYLAVLLTGSTSTGRGGR